ncbi:MAG: diguanylate cyclase [Syntrophomonadaceae bacterium]|nr:diguanylate cyclase [Syntrophomonadaceae bacterium]
MSDQNGTTCSEPGTSIPENIQYELLLRSALAQLYEPLVQPDASIEVISHLILHCCKIISGSQNGMIATINPNGCIVAQAQDLNNSIPLATLIDGDKLTICPNHDKDVYDGLLGYSVKFNAPLLSNDPDKHPVWRELPADYVPICNIVSVPVVIGAEIAGLVLLANSRRAYSDLDVDGAERIAKFFSLAIQRRRWESALRESQANLQALINNTSDLIWALDKNLRIIAANQSIKTFFKDFYQVNLEVGQRILELLPPPDRRTWEDLYQRALAGNMVNEEQAYQAGHRHLYLDITLQSITNQGQITGISGFARDITHHKLAEEQLRLYAATDVMTGVLNRRTGLAVLETQLQLCKRNNAQLTVCFVDLNDLKGVNDHFGHAEGDAYIMLVTQAMKANIRDMDTVCRMGGDEFLIIFPQCGRADAEAIYGRIDEELQEYNRQNRKPYIVSISHGTAQIETDNPVTAEDLVSLADSRMYEEKRIYKENLAKQKQ